MARTETIASFSSCLRSNANGTNLSWSHSTRSTNTRPFDKFETHRSRSVNNCSFCFIDPSGDLFGSMMTQLEDEILPFPHAKGIDLGPSMKRKVHQPIINQLNRSIKIFYHSEF